MDDDITIKTKLPSRDYVANIEIAFRDLEERTAGQAKQYINHLIALAVKQAVATQFGSIQRLVDETVHSDEMREKVFKIVEEEVRKKAAEISKEMFGE